MQIETTGILINIKPFNERDALAHIFTCDNGVLVGMLRGAESRKKINRWSGNLGASRGTHGLIHNWVCFILKMKKIYLRR